jgi:hypothetical protein
MDPTDPTENGTDTNLTTREPQSATLTSEGWNTKRNTDRAWGMERTFRELSLDSSRESPWKFND